EEQGADAADLDPAAQGSARLASRGGSARLADRAQDSRRLLLARRGQSRDVRPARGGGRGVIEEVGPDSGAGVLVYRVRLAHRRAQSKTDLRLPVLQEQGPLADLPAWPGRAGGRWRLSYFPDGGGTAQRDQDRREGGGSYRRWALWRRHQAECPRLLRNRG